jgi:hypothetical protein
MTCGEVFRYLGRVMVQGQILRQARRDNATMLFAFVVLVALSGGTVAYFAKFIYNFVAGPAPFTKALAAAPGMREFVRAEGQLVSTGSKEATVWRWAPRRGVLGALAKASNRSIAEHETVTANFMAMMIDGGILIVKVPPDFSGRVVEGKLVPVPLELREGLEAGSDPDSAAAAGSADPTDPSAAAATDAVVATARLHPQMIDATSSYRAWNLIVLAAVLILPLSLAGLWWAVRLMFDVKRHHAIARVAKHGPYLALIPRIEREMAAAGAQAQIGLLWVTHNWIVAFSPALDIFPVRDIIGIAHESKTKTSGNQTTVKHWITMWMRDEPFDKSQEVTEYEAQRILELLAARNPGIVVEDVDLVRKRWNADRAACMREIEGARRRAAAEAAQAAPPASPASADAVPTRVPA